VQRPRLPADPRKSLAYDADEARCCRYDPARAKLLLAEVGVSGSLDAVPKISARGAPKLPKLVQLVQADLGALGIRIRIEVVEQSTWVTRSTKGDYQMMTHSYGQAHKDPTSLCGTAVIRRPGDDPSGYSSPDYTRLVAGPGKSPGFDVPPIASTTGGPRMTRLR
jgi:ABC-type transport system substrate-binding protein